MKMALEGVRVVDFTQMMLGPWGTQFLGDMGAEVIKVERPKDGDDTRHWGPPFAVERSADGTAGIAGYFLCVNRGKKSVTIDIASERGQELVRGHRE